MASVILRSTTGDTAAPSKFSTPVMPHTLPSLLGAEPGRAAARRDFGLVGPAPVDHPLQPLHQVEPGLEADVLLGPSRIADAIAHQRGLAPRRIVDLLLAAGELDDHFRELLERGALARADVIEPVDHLGVHRAQIGL